jgi:hypothetical protein
MRRRFISSTLAGAAGLAAGLIALGPYSVLASTECLAQPNDQAVAAGHWYYRLDRISDRKCWHYVEPAPTTPPTVPASVSANSSPQPTDSSLLDWLLARFTDVNQAGTQQAFANREAGVPDATAPDTLNGGAALQLKRSHAAPHHVAATVLSSRQPQKLSELPPQAQTHERSAPPLTETERATLFREFLRWKQEQISQAR